MKPKAKIVLGTLFGDEGKGITTDFLCSRLNPVDQQQSTIVVRFSGGQQAGHNVVINGVAHTHSNFGSGTLRGCPSYFSEYCTVYPTTIYREMMTFKSKGIKPELYIHPLAKVTTPFDVAFARMMDIKNGRGNSCGLGIGITMKRNQETGYKLFAIDLENVKMLKVKMAAISQYYANLLSPDDRPQFFEMAATDMGDFYKCLEASNKVFSIKPYDFLLLSDPNTYGLKFDTIVFEGSQGILLDMDHGFFPHVTYSNTTSKNAIEICKKLGILDIEIYYAIRCYQTRHGNGWMSNDTPVTLVNTEHEINKTNDWQLDFKTAEIDYDLINYALDIDKLYHESVSVRKHLVITCLDQRPGFVFDFEKITHEFRSYMESASPDSKNMRRFIKSRRGNKEFVWESFL